MSHKKYSVASIGPKIEAFLGQVIERARFQLDFEMEDGVTTDPDFESPDVLVRFTGKDVDLLLENKAELLLALEHVTQEALRIGSEDHSRISFDANDYRQLRIEELRMSASVAAEKVKRTGQPFQFNPMNSRERRIIHLSLRNEKELRSESLGSGSHRMVVVYPAGMPSLPEPPPPPPAPRYGSRPPTSGSRDSRDRDRDRGRGPRGPGRRGPRR